MHMRARRNDDRGARPRVSQFEEGVGRGHLRQVCQQKGEAAGVRICRNMVLKLSKYLYGIWAARSLSMGGYMGVWVD